MGEYKLRKNRNGQWEVAHCWDDGATVQIRYFGSKKDAQKYLKDKGV